MSRSWAIFCQRMPNLQVQSWNLPKPSKKASPAAGKSADRWQVSGRFAEDLPVVGKTCRRSATCGLPQVPAFSTPFTTSIESVIAKLDRTRGRF